MGWGVISKIIKSSTSQTLKPKLWNEKVTAVGHITEIYGPVQALINYLKENTNEFTSNLSWKKIFDESFSKLGGVK